jgi:NitT/TauT family transport system ATP-binding protein
MNIDSVAAAGALRDSVRAEVRGLTKVFDDGRHRVTALSPIDLTIEDGSFVCIVGPSGCGKSTLLRMLAGLIRPTEGEIEIWQRDPSGTLLAMVFQDHSVFPWKTVRRNVELGLKMRGGMTAAQRRERCDDWIARLGLADFANVYPAKLSGGMRQRVSIARALAVEPEMLLMDEPFASLDAHLRLTLQLELLRLWEVNRRTVVFVTHALDEAILLGDRIVVMSPRPGRILADITVPFGRPRDFDTRAAPEFGALENRIWNMLRTAEAEDES